MEQVDFYVLSDVSPEAPFLVACRLAEKAWQKGYRVFIHTASPLDARRMDELLWSFRQDSFVPHGLQAAAGEADLPVQIGEGGEPGMEPDVLINLAGDVPLYARRVSRVAEIVGADDEARRQARRRYRYYREQPCLLRSHDL